MSLTGTGSSATASALLDLNVYEYAITFDEEVRRAKTIHFGTSLKRLKVAFLKKSRWNTVKILYLVCRYLPFLWAATNTSPRIVSEEIDQLLDIHAFFIPIVVITALFNSAPTFISVPGITSCSTASQSRIILLGYVLLVIGETEILLSTLYRSVQHYRVGGRSRLLTILVNHNVWYFGCSLMRVRLSFESTKP
ncbi:hypothetical protein BU15DRAFT_65290 [Melanogaster broomeanus]|nr:hypothetical protein BU15DRAFT_65290 [Melanogaster broomeanus]